MFLKHIDLTTALRPSYLPDEVLLFVQDNVGLYEGYVDVVPDGPDGPDGMPHGIIWSLKLTWLLAGNSRSQTIRMARSI